MGGTIGAVAIAVWFLCIDVSMGQPFRTPALLGATLFEGLKDPAALHPTVRVVLEYTLVHWVAFVAFGLVAAGLLAAADRDPRLLFVVFMLFCCFEVFALGLISVLAEWLFGVLAWWTLVLANFLAEHDVVLYDLCLFISADGETVFGEISQDCGRFRHFDLGSLDKDEWRAGGSSEHVLNKWQMLLDIIKR